MKSHNLYKDGDPDAPPEILDSNGQVALSLCRDCGKGESELEEDCICPVCKGTGYDSYGYNDGIYDVCTECEGK